MKLTTISGSIVFTMIIVQCIPDIDIENCRIKTVTVPRTPVEIHNKVYLVQTFDFILKSNSTSNTCYVNISKIMEIYKKVNEIGLSIGYTFYCIKPLLLLFSGIEEAVKINRQIDNKTSRNPEYNMDTFFMRGCTCQLENLFFFLQNIYLRFIDLRDIQIQNYTSEIIPPSVNMTSSVSVDISTSLGFNAECKNLLSVSVFSISSIMNFSFTDFIFFLSCASSFPRMITLKMQNLSITTFPNILSEKFPKLQTLDLASNDLVRPPPFPWTTEFLLPHEFNDSVYATDESGRLYLNQISNFFLPVLNLNDNKIVHLYNGDLKGYITALYLKSNDLKTIEELALANITGLEILQLGHNQLKSLPSLLLKEQYNLKYLDLRYNKISQLHPKTFHDLLSLQYLYLQNNHLTSIHRQLFASMNSIKSINLNNNYITIIDTFSFPVGSRTLQNLSISENYLRDIPEDIFYIHGLKFAYLKGNNISSLNLTRLQERINAYQFGLQEYTFHRSIDLTGNLISQIIADTEMDATNVFRLIYIMTNFKFILTDNPLQCFCDIVNFNEYVNKFRNISLTGKEYFIHEWKCKYPTEFAGKSIFSIRSNETYCKVDIPDCPQECNCYLRYQSNISIVDCRGKGLRELPKRLPDGVLDLWFQHNNISALQQQKYCPRIRTFLLSFNQISSIEASSLLQLSRLEVLYINSNFLAHIPAEFQNVPLRLIRMGINPLKCDCKTVWLKHWITANADIIEDFKDIKCTVSNDNKGRLLVEVDTKDFICAVDVRLKVVIFSTMAVVLFMSVVTFTCVYRLEIRVFLYLNFGIRWCDSNNFDECEIIDVIVVYPDYLFVWVKDHIMAYLEKHKMNIHAMPRDFIAGYTYQRNIATAIRNSKKMILVLPDEKNESKFCEFECASIADSNSGPISDVMQIAWGEALEKIRHQRKNNVIVVGKHGNNKSIQNKDMQAYLHVKKGRYINTSDKYFRQKLLYFLDTKNHSPPPSENVVMDIMAGDQNTLPEENRTHNVHIVYSENDRNIAISSVLRPLQEHGYSCYHEEDFTPGVPVLDSYVDAIRKSLHTIFLIPAGDDVDYNLLNAFRFAREKSDSGYLNHLIIVKNDNLSCNSLHQEIQDYISIHVTLNLSDQDFLIKLRKSLMRSTGSEVVIYPSHPGNQHEHDHAFLL